MSSAGKRLRSLRKSKGLTLKQLGELIGVSKQVISDWENGALGNIGGANLLRLADALATPPKFLLWGKRT